MSLLQRQALQTARPGRLYVYKHFSFFALTAGL
jgi:hypothetical protein